MRYYSICLTTLCLANLFFHPTSIRAENANDAPQDLAAAVRAAKQNYVPVTDSDVAQARNTLQTEFARLNQFLGTGPRGQGWRAFLRLNDLQAQLKAATPDLDTLNQVETQFGTDNSGLEMPVFSNVKAALESYIEAAQARGNADAKTQYEQGLEALAKALEEYAKKPSEENAQTIDDGLGMLRATRQGAALVKAIREQYTRPNLWAQVSEELLGAGINQNLDETGPVNDVILGANVHGTAHTTGVLKTELVPSQKSAIMDTVLVGKAESQTTAYKGPASVRSAGVTTFNGRKRIVFDANGLTGQPSCADADTCTTILGICVKSGLFSGMVSRIATKKTYQSKGEAQEIAADHAAARVRRRIEDEAGVSIARANKDYAEKFRNPLVRAGAFPELQFQSTDANLYVTGIAANGSQIGAPSAPPDLDSSRDMSVRLHESAVNNLAEAMYAGKTITDETVQADAIKTWGKVPEELQQEPDAEPWSMTFASTHPVIVSFFDGGFKITIRGQRYTSGEANTSRERKFQAMNISATYKVEKSGKGSKAVRQGDLEILPPGYVAGARLSNVQVTLRSLLQKRFGKVLKPEIVSEGLKLKGKWEKAGTLTLTQLVVSESGWASLGWDMDKTQPTPTSTTPPTADNVQPVEAEASLAQK